MLPVLVLEPKMLEVSGNGVLVSLLKVVVDVLEGEDSGIIWEVEGVGSVLEVEKMFEVRIITGELVNPGRTPELLVDSKCVCVPDGIKVEVFVEEENVEGTETRSVDGASIVEEPASGREDENPTLVAKEV